MPTALRKLGKRIRQLRKDKGLTQEAAAEKARLDSKHWSDIERAVTNVTVATLVGISRALKVPLYELFTDD